MVWKVVSFNTQSYVYKETLTLDLLYLLASVNYSLKLTLMANILFNFAKDNFV